MSALDDCRQALSSKNVQAFLRVLRAGESSQSDLAYTTMFGGKQFADTSHHPGVKNSAAGLTSTAAGAYQFIVGTWSACQHALNLPDFSPASQDLAAVYLIRQRGALDDVLAGNVVPAIAKCGKEWASLPGSPYGQPTRTLTQALATYAQFGGVLQTPAAEPAALPAGEGAPDAPYAPKEKPVLPILAALLPSLIDAVPKLGALFGSGSDVATRNVKAVGLAFNLAKDALGAANEQEVVTKLQNDPAAVETVRKAVEDNWYALTESGGGGIDGARKHDAVYQQPGATGFWRAPAFWVFVMLLPLIYGTVWLVLTGDFASEVKSMVVAAVVSGVLGSGTGFFLGSSFSSQRKDDTAAAVAAKQ